MAIAESTLKVCAFADSTRESGDPDDVVEGFLEGTYDLSDKGLIHSAGDRIYDFTQRAFRSSHFARCDRALELADVDRLRPELRLAFLALTMVGRDKLTKRTGYFVRAYHAFARERGEAGASKLLAKYR